MESITFEQFGVAAEQVWNEAQLDISSYGDIDPSPAMDKPFVELVVASVLARLEEELFDG